MIKNYVIDTNVMVHDPNFLYSFEDNNVIVPITCIEELDDLKKREGVVGFYARSAAREINKIRKLGNLHEGVRLENGGTFRIEIKHMDMSILPDGMSTQKKRYQDPGHYQKPADGEPRDTDDLGHQRSLFGDQRRCPGDRSAGLSKRSDHYR